MKDDPSGVDARSNGPEMVVSQSGTLWFFPSHIVLYPFCLRISATVAALLGIWPV